MANGDEKGKCSTRGWIRMLMFRACCGSVEWSSSVMAWLVCLQPT